MEEQIKTLPQCYQCKIGFQGCEIGRMVILYHSQGYEFEFFCSVFQKYIYQPPNKEVIV